MNNSCRTGQCARGGGSASCIRKRTPSMGSCTTGNCVSGNQLGGNQQGRSCPPGQGNICCSGGRCPLMPPVGGSSGVSQNCIGGRCPPQGVRCPPQGGNQNNCVGPNCPPNRTVMNNCRGGSCARGGCR